MNEVRGVAAEEGNRKTVGMQDCTAFSVVRERPLVPRCSCETVLRGPACAGAKPSVNPVREARAVKLKSGAFGCILPMRLSTSDAVAQVADRRALLAQAGVHYVDQFRSRTIVPDC